MRLPLMCATVLTVLPAIALPFAPAGTSPIATAAAAPVVEPRDAESASPIAGTYECQGVEPDGTPYRGVVQIIPSAGTYEVVWIFASGQQYSGLGVVNGDVLAVSYFTNRPGVVAYRIEQSDSGPRLQGQWTVVGAGKVYHETLTRMTTDVKRIEPPPAPAPRHPSPLMRHLRPA
jgi:hypothetical protein